MTYAELADRLGITLASANKLARRKRWARAKGNDRLARVQVPDEALARAPDPAPDIAPDPTLVGARTLIARLEGELVGLREALAEARTRAATAEARAGEEAAKTGQAIAAFEAHNATLKAELERRGADVERLGIQLAAAETRAEKQAAELGADLAAERERADKAIAAFAALAERLDALAAERARPWWRRLVG